MVAHAHDLRDEIAKQHPDWSPARVLALTAAIVRDFETASIDEPTRALLRFAVQLTRYHPAPTPADLDALRAHGFSDTELHDAVQVIGFFNYIVRVADALGVPLDPWLVEFERELESAPSTA
jgi:uncharacterized peroxidase-related enzyme